MSRSGNSRSRKSRSGMRGKWMRGEQRGKDGGGVRGAEGRKENEKGKYRSNGKRRRKKEKNAE